jgi:hypothetical protein
MNTQKKDVQKKKEKPKSNQLINQFTHIIVSSSIGVSTLLFKINIP